ncbi:MAG: TonB-dependent receptor [Alphaproteobacteria bacterium]|nr:TonB-dependent receptor [Alphaproteobacteria bacterium]
MSLFKKFAFSAATVALMAAAPAAVHAQQTSSQLRGTVVDASGAPISGATVTILHTNSNTAATATTGATGAFFESGLRVGGPYTIYVSAAGFEGDVLEGLSLSAGSNAPISIVLNSAAREIITVTGAAINTLDLNNGVGSNFSARDIANQPSANRDVIGTLLRDPLASSGGEGNLTVAGVNPRFNGLAIDGSLQQDDFGLSSNTYATQRSPISIDAIESASLVASDYSVTAAGFTGGLVNITTRSGTNEFDGSAYYYFQDETFYGNQVDGRDVTTAAFEEKEWGVTLGGPIIEDRLFFFVSYDEFNSASGQNFAESDVNDGIDPSFYGIFNQYVLDNLGYDMGGRPTVVANPETSERMLVKLDWNINEDHRASFTYQTTEESEVSTSRQNYTTAWYQRPQELDSYSLQLFSDWTPNLSTTFRATLKENNPGQLCNAGAGQPHLEFRLSPAELAGSPMDGLISGGSETFVGGCDRFRHANIFNDERLQLFGSADYVWGDHVLTFGAEYETYELLNVFVPASNGRFIYNDLTNIVNNDPQIDYVNAPTNNAIDGGASWSYDRFTLFAQDTWQIRNDLEVSYGVRWEFFSQDDQPAADPLVTSTYGLESQSNLDDKDLFMPRASFRWTPTDRTTVTGGFGLFAGGSPQVWVSNSFQGLTAFARQSQGTPISSFDIPASLEASVAASSGNRIDIIDPDFEIPSDWKASIRVDHEFDMDFGGFDLGDNYLFSAQYLYSTPRDAFQWRNLAQTELAAANPTGVAPDGRTIYADLDDLGISNLTMLTNADGAESHVFTVSLAKEYDNGLGFFVSYAYQDANWISEGGSSRGISNWRGISAVDRNFPEERTSFFEIEDTFRIGLSYEREFLPELNTRFDLFGNIRSGQPYFAAFDVDNDNSLFGRAGDGEGPFDNNPAYIPTGLTDPNVVFASGFNTTAFFDYVDEIGLSSGIQEVNGQSGGWRRQWDLRIQQELPGIGWAEQFVGDNNFSFVLDIINFPNLLNDEWGVQYNAPSFGQLALVEADLVSAADVAAVGIDAATALTGDAPRTTCQTAGDCVYRFNDFNGRDINTLDSSDSVYQIRMGIRYEF